VLFREGVKSGSQVAPRLRARCLLRALGELFSFFLSSSGVAATAASRSGRIETPLIAMRSPQRFSANVSAIDFANSSRA
jgi:hypothetical protein